MRTSWALPLISSALSIHAQVLDWVTIRGLKWGTAPVESMINEKLLSQDRCMLWVVVLNESMSIWIEFHNHRQKCLLQYANVGNCIHTPYKNTNTQSPFLLMAAHTCTFVGSFGLGLYLGFRPDLVQHNLCSFIREYDIPLFFLAHTSLLPLLTTPIIWQ